MEYIHEEIETMKWVEHQEWLHYTWPRILSTGNSGADAYWEGGCTITARKPVHVYALRDQELHITDLDRTRVRHPDTSNKTILKFNQKVAKMANLNLPRDSDSLDKLARNSVVAVEADSMFVIGRFDRERHVKGSLRFAIIAHCMSQNEDRKPVHCYLYCQGMNSWNKTTDGTTWTSCRTDPSPEWFPRNHHTKIALLGSKKVTEHGHEAIQQIITILATVM
jgi:hypothetical protein